MPEEPDEASALDSKYAGVMVGLGLVAALGLLVVTVAGIKILDPSTSGVALIELLKALLWPAFAVFAVVVFATPIRDLLWRINSAEVDAKSGKVSFKLQARVVAETLHQAVLAHGGVPKKTAINSAAHTTPKRTYAEIKSAVVTIFTSGSPFGAGLCL